MDVIAFLSYVFVVTFTPGPNNIMSMANGSKFGYKKSLYFLLGVFCGIVTVILLCCYFNLILLKLLPKVKIYMAILGIAYLIYLAIKIITSKENTKENKVVAVNSYYTGILLQFLNPKLVLFGITIVATFLIDYLNSHIAIILFSLFLGGVGFLSISSWALFGSLFSKFFSKYRKPFNIVMGLLLIYTAISIIGLI